MNPTSVRPRAQQRARLGLGLGLILLAAVTASRYIISPFALGAGVWPLVVLVAVYLMLERIDTFGWFSIAGVTAAMSLAAFWLKWLVDSQPHAQLHVLPFDNNLAIRAYGIFVLAFAVGWRFAVRGVTADREATNTTFDHRITSRTAVVALAVGLLLVATRLLLANHFMIGVPGVSPTSSGPLRPLLSMGYYLSVAGPLAIASLLATYGPRRFRWFPALSLLLAFTVVGASLGYRSYAVLAFITVTFSIASARHVGEIRTKLRAGQILLLLVAAAGAALGLNLALTTRSGTQAGAPEGILSFLSERVGGLDYLSPVVPAIDRSGSHLAFLDPSAWDAFMRVNVYGFPSSAVTGVSATLPGLLYGVLAAWGLLIGGLVFGLLGGWLDKSCLRLRGRGPIGGVLTLGVILSWSNLLGEGTLRAAFLQGLGFVGVSLLLMAFDDRLSTKSPRPRLGHYNHKVHRGGQRID
jgi:hypothetical protein